MDSCHCLLLHKLSKNLSIIYKELDAVPCSGCKRLLNDLNQCLKSAPSPAKKAERQKSTSHFPLKYLSPTSQKKRRENSLRDQNKTLKHLQKYSHTELTLDDEQHNEISKLVTAINEKVSTELEALLVDIDTDEIGSSIREIWEVDTKRAKEDFKKDQEIVRTILVIIKNVLRLN